jgi:transcriptional regulator with XRE-family HTH domain
MRKTLRSPEQILFIDVLKAARQRAGVTQQVLAGRLNRPQSFVAKYENGERRIDVVEFVEVAQALKLDPAALFRRYLRAIGAPRPFVANPPPEAGKVARKRTE